MLIRLWHAPMRQARLGALKYFMVGCGALGCELLKNFAMMGLASGPEGRIVVTDDDVIEKSNLSRQFLFRNHNVGHSKSQAASRAVLGMNPGLKIDARQAKHLGDLHASLMRRYRDSKVGV